MLRHLSPQGARTRYLAPTVALGLAGVLLVVSLFLPYWELTLVSTEHPSGVRLQSYLGHLEGEVEAVLALAGGPGAMRLRDLAKLERSLAVATVTVVSLLVLAATFVHNRWAVLLALPAIAFPVIVVADTRQWLRSLAQGGAELTLRTEVGGGLLLAGAASLTVIAGLWLHRHAYRATPPRP
jgi:hypothetical protein